MNRILLVNKEEGITSNQLVNTIKRKFNLAKVGHAGTLDPFATGLMIVMCDEATKLSPYLMMDNKSYEATLVLGKETDSYDKTGNIINTQPVPVLNEDIINKVLESFVGEINQVPPMYSAIKVNGKKLYQLARKGKDIEISARKVKIHELKLLSYKDNTIQFYCNCSKGTYIRSLAVDIAKKLNTVGYLSALNRLSSGYFNLKDAKNVDDLSINDGIEMKDAVNFKKVIVDDTIKQEVKCGKHIYLDCDEEKVLLIDKQDKLLAIYKKENDYYICERGFN